MDAAATHNLCNFITSAASNSLRHGSLERCAYNLPLHRCGCIDGNWVFFLVFTDSSPSYRWANVSARIYVHVSWCGESSALNVSAANFPAVCKKYFFSFASTGLFKVHFSNLLSRALDFCVGSRFIFYRVILVINIILPQLSIYSFAPTLIHQIHLSSTYKINRFRTEK